MKARRKNSLKRCPETGKVSFGTELAAMAAGAQMNTARRQYKCPHCGMWHHTTKRVRKDVA